MVLLLILFLFSTPVYAAGGTAIAEIKRISDVLAEVLGIFNALVFIAVSLVFLLFFWGLADYIRKDRHELDEAKKKMFWGVIAIFVLTSIWGIVYFLELILLGGREDGKNIETLVLPRGVTTAPRSPIRIPSRTQRPLIPPPCPVGPLEQCPPRGNVGPEMGPGSGTIGPGSGTIGPGSGTTGTIGPNLLIPPVPSESEGAPSESEGDPSESEGAPQNHT